MIFLVIESFHPSENLPIANSSLCSFAKRSVLPEQSFVKLLKEAWLWIRNALLIDEIRAESVNWE